MPDVELKRLVMAGPMRWIVLTAESRVTTLAWFVHVGYAARGGGMVLFARSDLRAAGHDDVFAVFSDNRDLAQYLRDEVFNYSAFAGAPGERSPAPIVDAKFESETDWPRRIRESMRATDGTSFSLTFSDLSEPMAYVRRVNDRRTEVGAYCVPARFSLEINGVTPVGRLQAGPLAEAPPAGADLQNLWYDEG